MDILLNKKKKKMYVWIFITILFCFFIFIYIHYFTHKNYIQLFKGDIYQKFNEMRTYDKCIQFNGKPDKEIIGNIPDNPEWKEWLVYYDGIIVEYVYHEDGRIGEFRRAMFSTNNYSFGKKNVSVGMSRVQIEKIFRYSKKSTPHNSDVVIVYDENGNGEKMYVSAYYDDAYEIAIGFLYDDNDCVSKIFLSEGIY